MNAVIGLLTETFLHPGMGQQSGAIDLPVARESTTQYPVIFGSSVKGALRDTAEHAWGKQDPRITFIFGQQENAGGVLVSDARLLLLPIRSLHGAYKWVTCPHLLERFQRDANRAGVSLAAQFSIPALAGKQASGATNGAIVLEERRFDIVAPVHADTISSLKSLIRHTSTANRLEKQLVVISDDQFSAFAKYGLQIQAHNTLNDITKQSDNLWYEENLPPDTLLYMLLAERQTDAVKQTVKLLEGNGYVQLGGGETTGKGWMSVTSLGGSQ
jgi:CRISPR-associated protein Cmr4